MALNRFVIGLGLFSYSFMGCQSKTVRPVAPASTISAPAVESRYTLLADTTQKEMVGTPILTTKQIKERLLALGDSDGDGQLSDVEKTALHERWEAIETDLKEWIKAHLDADGDGTVDEEDIQKSLKKLSQSIRAEREDILDNMDALRKEASTRIMVICEIERDDSDHHSALALSLHDHGSYRSGDCDDELPDIDDLISQCSAADRVAAEAVADSLEDKLEVLQDELDELTIILDGIDKKCH